MCPGLAERWLDHKATKHLEVLECSNAMSPHSVQNTRCEMQGMSPLGVWVHGPQENFEKYFDIEFCSKFDYKLTVQINRLINADYVCI